MSIICKIMSIKTIHVSMSVWVSSVCFCVPSVRSAAVSISMHLSLMGSPVCRRGDKGPTPELNDGERGLVGVVGVFGVSGLLLLYGGKQEGVFSSLMSM